MLKNVFLVVLVTSVVAGCGSSEPEEKPAAEAQAQAPPVGYALGFLPLERGEDGSTWRWMGSEGIIRLKNTHRDMRLSIKGRAPLELTQLPTINFEFNGEPLDPIPSARGEVQIKHDISPGRQGSEDWSRLRITTNQTFVPHETHPESQDSRRLGFAVYEVLWEPK